MPLRRNRTTRRRAELPRKRKRSAQEDTSTCPCGCGATDLSERTKYYHLAGRGLHVADTKADHGDDVDLAPSFDVEHGHGDADDDVQHDGAGAAAAGSVPNQSAIIADAFMSDMRRVVGVLSMGALVTLVMALQLRHHLANAAAEAMCQILVCVSLAALPLLSMKRTFARLFYPTATDVLFCPRECVGLVGGGLGASATCPGCGEQMTDRKGVPAHVSPHPCVFSRTPHTHVHHRTHFRADHDHVLCAH